MASNITLYYGPGGGPSMRVQVCLEEKGLSGYNGKLLNTEKNEHKSEEVLKINPRGQFPAMKHGDVAVNDSLAACLYLENAFKNQGTKLIPDNPAQQALVFQRMFEADNISTKAFDGIVWYKIRTKPEDQDEAHLAKKRKELVEELGFWEGHLAKVEGPYLTGRDFTLADVSFFPMLAVLVRLQLPLKERFPRLDRYYEQVKERSSIKTSWPPEWEAKPAPDLLKDV